MLVKQNVVLDNEPYFRQQVLLNSSWRNETDLNPNNERWSVIHELLIQNANQQLNLEDEIAQHLDSDSDDDQFDDLIPAQLIDNNVPDWIQLAEAGPNDPINRPFLGQRMIDFNIYDH